MAASGGHWSKGNFKPAAGTIAKAKGAAAAKNMAAATQKGPTVATYKEWEKGEAVHIGPSGYMDANGKPLGYEITSANQNDMGTIATHPSKEALQAWAKQQGLKVIQSGKYIDGPGQFGVSAAQFAKASQMFGQKPAAAPKASETPKPLKFTGSATKNYYNTGVVYKGKSTFEGTIQKMNFSDPKAKWAVSMDINGRKKTAMDYFSSLKAAKAEVDAAYKNWLKG